MALVRKNIRMSEEVATWYEEKANKLGVSQTNLMVMALSDYIKQDRAMDMMDKLKEMQKMIEKMPKGE